LISLKKLEIISSKNTNPFFNQNSLSIAPVKNKTEQIVRFWVEYIIEKAS